MEQSKKQNIVLLWLIWHFYEMPKFLLEVWKNYIFFALNYFSLPILLKSLFAPWHRYKWKYPKVYEVAEFFNTLVSNLFSRFLGALIRITLIAVGIAFQIFVVFAGLVIILLWILIPFIVIAGFSFVYAI